MMCISQSHFSKQLRIFQGMCFYDKFYFHLMMKPVRFYIAIQDLHSLVMAIDDKDNTRVLSSIQKAEEDFKQEIESVYISPYNME